MTPESERKEVADAWMKERLRADRLEQSLTVQARVIALVREAIEDMINSGEILQEPLMEELLSQIDALTKEKLC